MPREDEYLQNFRRGSLMPAANAAAALAQLHYHRPDGDWDPDQGLYADHDQDSKRAHFVDPALQDHNFTNDSYLTTTNAYPTSTPSQVPGLLPSSLERSPPTRSSTLPPIQRSISKQANRPRKSSITQNARKPKHERRHSKDHARKPSHDRKALSAEPSAAALFGKRWEDLLDAATSATEEDSRDLTPVSLQASIVCSSFTTHAKPDTRLTLSLAPSPVPDIPPTIRLDRLTIPVLYRITSPTDADPSATGRHPRSPTLPLGRIVPRIDPPPRPPHEPPPVQLAHKLLAALDDEQLVAAELGAVGDELPHHADGRQLAHVRAAAGADLLRRLQAAERAEGELRVHRVHLRTLSGVRRCARAGAGKGPHCAVSSL
ncbi:hypothetical protein LTR66_013914 [Elasticomyces elasticus]|nr:hypothetical protein LTR66_013914 [Elasticomyces elasticus]